MRDRSLLKGAQCVLVARQLLDARALHRDSYSGLTASLARSEAQPLKVAGTGVGTLACRLHCFSQVQLLKITMTFLLIFGLLKLTARVRTAWTRVAGPS